VPGQPDASVLVFRIEAVHEDVNFAAAVMPQIGRSVMDEEGVALVRDWISGMDGSCP
jgi:hypothetical protein